MTYLHDGKLKNKYKCILWKCSFSPPYTCLLIDNHYYVSLHSFRIIGIVIFRFCALLFFFFCLTIYLGEISLAVHGGSSYSLSFPPPHMWMRSILVCVFTSVDLINSLCVGTRLLQTLLQWITFICHLSWERVHQKPSSRALANCVHPLPIHLTSHPHGISPASCRWTTAT